MEENTKFYVGEKLVVSEEVTGKTPAGGDVLTLTYEEGKKERMSRTKYLVVRSEEKSDATAARNRLVKDLGSKLYGIMVEYGLKISEVDPVVGETIQLVNNGQEAAINALFDTEYSYERTLLHFNDVLIEKYGKKDPQGNDGTPS